MKETKMPLYSAGLNAYAGSWQVFFFFFYPTVYLERLG